jgi:mono/diheme cytochrome c family protein
MRMAVALCSVLAGAFGMVSVLAADGGPAGLRWASTFQSHDVQRGQTNAHYSFQYANSAATELTIHAVRATCPCTSVRFPAALPARIGPGESGVMEVNVDLRDRYESFKQTVSVESSRGTNGLKIAINMPELTQRQKDQRVAFANRQALFSGQCATCHLTPAQGKPMAEQYAVLCGTCHDATNRAPMVPDLARAGRAKDRAYWEEWMRKGKPGTFMPAFGKPWGGPWSEKEIQAMTTYLLERKTSQVRRSE